MSQNPSVLRRGAAVFMVAAAAVVLSGCAGMATLTSEVSTFGEWPPARKAGTYAFERLPSQQAKAELQAQLEAAAQPALAAAGFQPAASGAEPEVLVQLGLRSARQEPSPWSDPLWWRGGYGAWRYNPWVGVRWNPLWHDEWRRIDREAAVLIRDRASGKPLYEARATTDSSAAGTASGLRALFAAALKDFPATGINPRDVRVLLTD